MKPHHQFEPTDSLRFYPFFYYENVCLYRFSRLRLRELFDRLLSLFPRLCTFTRFIGFYPSSLWLEESDEPIEEELELEDEEGVNERETSCLQYF